MKVVCKFKCQEVTKSNYNGKLLFSSRFEQVDKLQTIPSGRLDVKQEEDLFEPGKEYFVTVSDGAT